MRVTAATNIYGNNIKTTEDLHPVPEPTHYTYLFIRNNDLHPHLCELEVQLSKGRTVGITVPIAELRRMLDAVSV